MIEDGDCLGNFLEEDYAIMDIGTKSQQCVFIIAFIEGESYVLIRDEQGQEYEVNVLRLSK